MGPGGASRVKPGVASGSGFRVGFRVWGLGFRV